MTPKYRSLEQVQADLKAGLISCRQLTEYYLKNIEANKSLNAFAEVYAEEALATADSVDAKLKNGTAGKLAGMVIGLKDVLCHKGHGLQASSKILAGFKSQFTGTAVQRVLDADAIVIGRQSCDEFAMGSSNENACYGPVRNAADPERVPGGSSGGSAVAVQADMCLASLGSDTGGSVRQPAAFCGVVGLKPTYSRISRYGLIAYASSFDCIGPITQSVQDAALLLEVMAGTDEFDSTVSTRAVPTYSTEIHKPQAALRIGYLRASIEGPGVSASIKAATQNTLDRLKEAGHEVSAFDFPLLDRILPTYYILTTAEASSNLQRYDGVKFGYRSPEAKDLESLYKNTRSQGFGKEVRKRIMLGTFVLSAGFYDAYYTKAQKVRRLIKDETAALFTRFDYLVMPTTTTTAFKIGEHGGDPISMYLADIFTVHANLAGIPAMSIPVGEDESGLPIGIQLMAPAFDESGMMALALSLEKVPA
jgi:aspartyl-tRNA(Asn)/glutamyl-tRNA(Gln) amidotransferase subunit A